MRISTTEAFQKFGDNIFTVAFNICQNRMDADDIVQDTLLKYHSLNLDYESEAHLRAWLLRVAINRAKDLTTSFWQKNKTSWQEYMSELSFTEPTDSHLFEAVMSLPQKYRLVLHLFYYEDYAISEIAGLLQCREGTVKSRLSRGRKLLKNKLMEEWNDDEQANE